MIAAFVNCFKIPELRDKIIFTLVLLLIARVVANIPLPGIDPAPLQDFFAAQSNESGSLLGLYNMFTGGALLKGAIGALGIMPYISASIIFQLLGAAWPSIARLQQEGDVGRQKINQYTRYATVLICVVQGALLILSLENPGRLFPGYSTAIYGEIVLINHAAFLITSVIFLTAGTILLMWLGEQITNRGIGNGISLLITIGIIADIPNAISLLFRLFTAPVGATAQLGIPQGILLLGFLFLCVAGIIMIVQAQRKIPVQYAKRMVGKRVYGGQSSFLPLKVNYAGVMPVIFASAILLFFQTIFSWTGTATDLRFLRDFGANFQHGAFGYYLLFGGLIFIFAYFWVSVMFKPIQVADDLKKYGGYIPGVRPGEPTARFLDFTMTRLTFAGASALVIIALIPDIILYTQNIPYVVAQFFGGTGMLIIVGVTLDTLRQVETYLLQRHYDGFLKKGRIRGRSTARLRQPVDMGGLQQAGQIGLVGGILLAAGLLAALLNLALFSN